MKIFKDYILRILVVVLTAVVLSLPTKVILAQNNIGDVSLDIGCFPDSVTIDYLRDFVSIEDISDSTCYFQALSILELFQKTTDEESSLLTAETPEFTIGMLFDSMLNSDITFAENYFSREGTKKELGGSRDGKGSGGAGSISVDEDAPYNAYSASQLVQEVLVTGCLTADNITFSGNESVQIGYFNNNGISDFPISEGIVLSTGNVVDAMGPNTATNITTEVDGYVSDPQLASIATGDIYDASVLEFDFIPAGNTVTFSYIFASEEYPEYACSEYNDVFGFFVTSLENDGIGYDNQNVAVLPDGSAVSINNVRPGVSITSHENRDYGCLDCYTRWWRTYCFWYDVVVSTQSGSNCDASNIEYYSDFSTLNQYCSDGDNMWIVDGLNDNVNAAFEPDGRTVKLTATFTAVPCSTYHIKLAVGDVADRKWDSWVFLEANSFSSNDVELTAYGNGVLSATELYEGCTNNSLVISREGADNSQNLNVGISYNPAIMNGTDIVQMDGTPLPESITIPAGVDSDTLFYYAPEDGIIENSEAETFTLSFHTGCPCDPTPNSISLDLSIFDAISLENPDIIATNVECSGESNGVIVVNPHGGSGSYEFQLDGGTWQYSNTFTNLSQGTYTIAVRDSIYERNCQPAVTVSNIEILEPEPVVASAGTDITICNGETTNLNGSGGALFVWSPSDWLSATNIASPTVTPSGVTNTPVSKTYTLSVYDANGNCESTDQVTVTVNPTPEVGITADGNTTDAYDVCPDDITTLSAEILNSTQTTTSIYAWSTGESSQTINVSPNSSQSYDVTVENEYGCSNNDNINIQVYPIYVTVDAVADVICPEDADAGATVNVSGHDGIFPVSVSVTSDQGYSNTLSFTEAGQQLISELGVGSYSATGTSSTIGCSATDNFIIDATDDIPPALDFRKAGDTLVVIVIPEGQNSSYVSVPAPQVADNCSADFDNDYTGTSNASGDYPVGTTTVTYTATDSNGNITTLEQKVEVWSDASFLISCPPDLTLGYNPDEADFTEDLDLVQTSVTGNNSNKWTLESLTSVLNDPTGGPCDFVRTRTYTARWVRGNGKTTEKTCDRTYYYSVDIEDPSVSCDSDITVNLSAYNPEYLYYKEIVLSEQSNTYLSNYQLRIDVEFVSGKMNSDYSDLRFLDSDKATALDFWVETYDGTRAVCWVKIPALSASSTKTIFLEYGNASATSLSNASNTFIFYDDFETWNGWADYGSGSVVHNTVKFPGINTLQKTSNCDPAGGYKLIGETITSFRMITRQIRAADGSSSSCGSDRYGIEDSGHNGYSINRAATSTGSSNFGYEVRTNGSGSNSVRSSHNNPIDNWYRIELMKDVPSNTVIADLYDDNRVKDGDSETGTNSNTSSFDRVTIHGGHDYFFDFIAVGTFTLNEPTIAFGAEQENNLEDCEVLVTITSASGADNCELISVEGVRSDGLPLGDAYIPGTTTITWTATDGAGNTNDCTQDIIVVDDVDPEIICPANILNTITDGTTSMTVTPGDATGTDNCTAVGDLTISSSRSDGLAISDPYPLGTTTILWTVEDESGNSATCNQEIQLVSDRFPGGVSNGLALWYKSNEGAFNGSNSASHSDPVSLWDDYVRNFDGKQASADQKPVFNTSAAHLNNYNPGILFDGVDDYLISELATTGLEETNTIFVVATPQANGAAVGIGDDSYIGYEDNNVVYVVNGTGTTKSSDTWSWDETKILSAVKAGDTDGDIHLFFNGVETAYSESSAGSINIQTDTRIGVDVNGASGKYFSGNIAEIIIYSRELSVNERLRVESYLAVKYGITM